MPLPALDVDPVVRLDDRGNIAIDELSAMIVNDSRLGAAHRVAWTSVRFGKIQRMIAYPVLIFFSIVFFELFMLLQMNKGAMAILAHSRESAHVLISSDMADEEKEILARRGAAEIFKATFLFMAKLLLVVLALYFLFVLTVAQFPSLGGAIVESLVSPIAVTILAAAVICYAWGRKVILRRFGCC